MNKKEVYQYLDAQGIRYEVAEHRPVFTVEDAGALQLPHPEAGAKNLFLRDDKKKNYYLVTMRDHLTVDLKQIQQAIGSRRLSFASEEDLRKFLALERGSVTPLGLLNDAERKVKFYLDRYFSGHLISVHPNENTATVFLQTEALLSVLDAHGGCRGWIEFPEALERV